MRLLLLTLLVITFHSCLNDDFTSQQIQNQTEQEEIIEPDRIIGLGKKLNNPYTVLTMRQAYKNLKENNKNVFSKTGEDSISIETTDYYVRFLPKNDQEKGILQDQDELTLFDMPLDYELEEGVAGAYHDPSIPTDQITWQYTVVPVDYQFRTNNYEILDDLYLQDEYDDEEDASNKRSDRNKISKNLWIQLENEAFRITGNDDDISEKSTVAARSKWYPSGTILYEDNTTATSRNIPLSGVKIIVKRWFKWKSDITKSDGSFETGSFRSSKVKCAIKWERADWDIRSGSYGQAWYSFESLRKGRTWDKTIRKSSTPRNWLYASVHRGAKEYFDNHNSYGIKKPFDKPNFITPRLHIGAKYKSGRAHYFTFNKIWWAAPVVIYSNNKDSRDLFATTIHELAHVSHWEIGYSTAQWVIDYLDDDPFLPESWAIGVEHTVINRVYPDRGTAYEFPYDLDRQDWTLSRIQTSSEGYTPIVIDMIDNINQSTSSINGTLNPNRPNDRVSGYTLGQLEDALPGSFGSWWRWRTRLREMYNNPTDGEELDYLFRNYK